MKPYYVLAAVGAEDETGAPAKFGVLGADSPAEAEGLVRQVAEMHRQRGESVELCVLQNYKAYPASLLKALAESEARERLLKTQNERWVESQRMENKVRLEEKERTDEVIHKLKDEIAALKIPKNGRKKATKKKHRRGTHAQLFAPRKA